MPILEPRDRIFVTGETGEGKSLLTRSLFLAAPPPKVAVDPVGASMTQVPGAVTFRDPKRVPDAAVARFVPHDPTDLDAYDMLHAQLWARLKRAVAAGDPTWWSLWLWVDEAGLVLPVVRTPPQARTMVITGRKWNVGGAWLHTRPREVAKAVPANAQHTVIFGLALKEDRQYVAEQCAIPVDELDQALGELPDGAACLWWERRTKTLHPMALEAT